MRNFPKVVIAALAFGGSISTASAAGVITDITPSGAGLVNLTDFSFDIDEENRALDLTKIFASQNPPTDSNLDPIVLTFTVEHRPGPGNPYAVTEAVTNNTPHEWIDFHYTIGEPDQGQGVVFTEHTNSTFGNFTLDQSSGPRNLDFSGSTVAAMGGTADATFNISPFDPGQGNTMTFTLTQVPTIPEPETYAMLLAGLGLMGFMAKRRSNNQNA